MDLETRLRQTAGNVLFQALKAYSASSYAIAYNSKHISTILITYILEIQVFPLQLALVRPVNPLERLYKALVDVLHLVNTSDIHENI